MKTIDLLDDRLDVAPASVPTSALQGSDQKIEVMAARVAAGESCFHPADGRDDIDLPPMFLAPRWVPVERRRCW